MKKLLLIVGLLWSAVASAQFVPGQILTAAELNSQFALYAPLTGAIFTGPVTLPSVAATGTFSGTSTTQGRLDNSTSLATDAFVNQQGASAVATVPFAGVTGGIYNQATLGSGCQVVVFASSGVITSSLTISNPGSGYAVGDLLAVTAGNSDAVLRVTGVSGGGVTSVGIAYGGTGYSTGIVATAMSVPPGRRAVVFTGTLTSNLTFIIQNGTFLTASREAEFVNNTTGAFTITVKLSNGAGGSTGTGVVLPQGTSSSTALAVYTDGVNDVWLANAGAVPSTVPLSSLAVQAANTIVANATAGSAHPTAISAPSCSTSSSALQWTSGTGLACNSAINASTLGGVAAASYLTSATAASTYATIAQATTALAATGGSINGVTVGATTPSTVAATTLSSTGNFTPSQTAGIIGTTTNNNANAGSVGEYLEANTLATPLTTGTLANATSISLTAGDWDVTGIAAFVPAGTTITVVCLVGVSTVSGTVTPINGSFSNISELWPAQNTPIGSMYVNAPVTRISLSTTTTVYLVAQSNFTVSTMTANGYIRARRVR